MNQRSNSQPYAANPAAIRNEIQRFESVHPSIYAIYDLIDHIPDDQVPMLSQQLRDHVVRIEDSFVNSQEWTLSRSVPDLRLGILGTLSSCKSALVHRYLTGEYIQEESPEGGRFKKEVMIDNRSYLLLIRDEGQPPDKQFTLWVDAVIFVFSLENEQSFSELYNYYAAMSHYRNTTDIPLILVGTQDAISESKPRVIDDSRARKLAMDLKRSEYHETCATYGLNVEMVFHDGFTRNLYNYLLFLFFLVVALELSVLQSILTLVFNILITNVYVDVGIKTALTSRRSCHKIIQTRIQMMSRPLSSQRVDIAVSASSSSSSSSQLLLQQQQQQQQRDQQQQQQREQNARRAAANAQQRNRYFASVTPEPQMVLNVPPPPPVETIGISGHQATSYSHHLHQQQQLIQQQQPLQQQQQPSLQQQLQQQQQQHHQHHPQQHHHTQCVKRIGQATPPSALLSDKPRPLQMEHYPPVTQAPVTPNVQSTPLATPVAMRKKSSSSLQKSNSFTTSNSMVLHAIEQFKLRSSFQSSHHGSQSSSQTTTSTSSLATAAAKKEEPKNKLGSGRPIPTKQGYLYKRSTKSLNKEWKKKYVILQSDGKLIYYPSINDYMSDSHGKDIDLRKTTVKIKGKMPKGSRMSQGDPNGLNDMSRGMENVSLNSQEHGLNHSFHSPDCNNHGDPSELTPQNHKSETPNIKKKHKRAKSGNNKNSDGSHDLTAEVDAGFEFTIVSLDNKQWQLEASSVEERTCWVTAIEDQIHLSLTTNESDKSRTHHNIPTAGREIRAIAGNSYCVDCTTPNPDWASLNLGSLICIECSGIHRNLGVNLSRVRSLGLDEWPPCLVAVMLAIGNELATRLWEANTKGRVKPGPTSSRDEKEVWIRAKYEAKEFIPPLPYIEVALTQQLIDAVARQDVFSALLVLCYCSPLDVNHTYSNNDTRTALHIASALGNEILVQLLIWAGADVKLVDHEGYNALWYAEVARSETSAELLKSHGCLDISTLSRRHNQTPTNSASSADNNILFNDLPSSMI